MNWSTVWELTKINILYSNPQQVTAAKRKGRKHGKKTSVYQSVMKQQLVYTLVFSVIYIAMFLETNFKKVPGYFSSYVALFFIMSIFSAFSAMYSIFYESRDVKLYAHLPIQSSELYIAKLISSFGVTIAFLMPLLSLFLIAYGQIIGWLLAIPLSVIFFGIAFLSVIVLSLYMNSFIGEIILKSHYRKLISTTLVLFSTIGSALAVLYINVINSRHVMTSRFSDRVILPYFRGFYDVVTSPFSHSSLLNFWLPLLLLVILLMGVVKWLMPTYYQKVLYTQPKEKATDAKKHKTYSLQSLLFRHHLSTLPHAALISQTYLMPLVYIVILITPSLSSGFNVANISTDYFGIAFIVGSVVGSFSSLPNSFVGVGISLEKANLTFLKTLPIHFKRFLVQKFVTLISLQAIVPLLIYVIVDLFLLKASPTLVIFFLSGFLCVALLQGQFMYHRDFKLLDLEWQDVTQLFNRRAGRWLNIGIFVLSLLVGSVLGIGTFLFGVIFHNVFLANVLVTLFVIFLDSCLQIWLYHNFWQKR